MLGGNTTEIVKIMWDVKAVDLSDCGQIEVGFSGSQLMVGVVGCVVQLPMCYLE